MQYSGGENYLMRRLYASRNLIMAIKSSEARWAVLATCMCRLEMHIAFSRETLKEK
jgi:hypothetical protein